MPRRLETMLRAIVRAQASTTRSWRAARTSAFRLDRTAFLPLRGQYASDRLHAAPCLCTTPAAGILSVPRCGCQVFSMSPSPASVTASHGLIWPGPADASTASAATAGPDFLPLAVTRHSSRGKKDRPRRPPLALWATRAASADRPGLCDRHRGRDGRGLESQKEN